MKKVRKAVIPAAGLGTRFLPATKAQAKEMLPIVDKPAIQYIVEEAIKSGIEEILIVNGRNKDAIENHFDKAYELENELRTRGKHDLLKISEDISEMVNIHFIRQKEAKGLGHAILCAKTFVGDEPFAVLLGDDIVDNDYPCLKQLIDIYDKYQGSVLGVQTVAMDQVDKYGIVDGKGIEENVYQVSTMVEKPKVNESPSNIAVLGRYVISPEIFNILEKTEPGVGGEIQLTDGLKKLANIENVYAYNFSGVRYDTGDKFGYLKANVEYALKHDEIKNVFRDYIIELASKL